MNAMMQRSGLRAFITAIAIGLLSAASQAQLIPPCLADFDGDGFLGYRDFDAFVVSFESGGAGSDLNGDGALTFEDFDAFVGAFERGCVPSHVSWLYPGLVYGTLDGPTSVGFGDFDSDGRPDMVVARSDAGVLSVWRNSTDPGGRISLVDRFDVLFDFLPQSVAVGDLNGDGRPDLATAMSYKNKVGLALNSSLGPGYIRFHAPLQLPTGAGARAIALGDLDADGDLDVGVACYDADAVWLYRNDGDGLFTSAGSVAVGPKPQSIVMSDLNADGLPEIAVTNDLGSSVSVLRNTTAAIGGAINFAIHVTYATPARPVMVAVGEFDGDGVPDLVSASSITSEVSIRLGRGDGTFSERIDIPTPSACSSIHCADLDGDGSLDIATTHYYLGTMSILRNRSETPGILRFERTATIATLSRPIAAAAGDLNADGLPDLAIVSTWGDSVGVVQNERGLGFVTRVDRGVTSDPRSVAIGDLNGDARPDVVATNYTALTASLILNLGNDGFSEKHEVEIGPAATSIAVADLNADGRSEIVVTNTNNAVVGVVQNAGVGGNLGFLPLRQFATGAGPYRVAIGDLDGDGRPDVAVSNYKANAVSVLRNISDPHGIVAFAPRVDLPVVNGPRAIVIADMDRDGKPDLVVGHRNEQSFCVIRNVSSSEDGLAFSAREVVPLPYDAERLAVSDLDGDGWLDLVVVDYYGRAFTTLISKQDGTFVPGPQMRTTREPFFCAVADVNRDDAPDIMIVNLFSNSVSVYLNDRDTDGTLGFGARTDYATGLYPYGLAIGDLNADGLLDFAVANSAAGSVSILLNQAGSTRP